MSERSSARRNMIARGGPVNPWWAAVLPILGVLFINGCGGDRPTSPEADTARPNVAVIVLDTLRADALSSYGNAKPLTPALDRVGAEGARFTRAYATDFWTLPTHASILTGLYPSGHGATSETNRLPSGSQTLATALEEHGYRTGAFIVNSWVASERGFDQGFARFHETWRDKPASSDTLKHDELTIGHALAWLDQESAAKDGGRPFFLFMNLSSAHMPYVPDRATFDEFTDGARPPKKTLRLTGVNGKWGHLGGALTFDDLDYQILRDLYDAEVAILDAVVGRLIDGLKERGLLDDTLFLVISDHGEEFGEHGGIDHLLNMYDEVTRIPLLLRFPARVQPGVIRSELVSQVDIFPTVLDAVGIDMAEYQGEGHSLLQAPNTAREFVIAENERPVAGVRVMQKAYPDYDVTGIDMPMRMLRTDRYKLVWWQDGRTQLFDVATDPDERNDLSQSNPGEAARLLGLLEAWIERNGTSSSGEYFETNDPESLEQLRALGYIK